MVTKWKGRKVKAQHDTETGAPQNEFHSSVQKEKRDFYYTYKEQGTTVPTKSTKLLTQTMLGQSVSPTQVSRSCRCTFCNSTLITLSDANQQYSSHSSEKRQTIFLSINKHKWFFKNCLITMYSYLTDWKGSQGLTNSLITYLIDHHHILSCEFSS